LPGPRVANRYPGSRVRYAKPHTGGSPLRKSLTTGLIAAFVLAIGAVAVYAAGNVVQTMKATVSPSKAGTAKKPKPVKVGLHLSTATNDGSVPPASNHVILFLPRGLIFQGSKFKSC